MASHTSFSEMVTIDCYCQDRFIDLLPVLDVDSHVSYEDLQAMWPAFQEILAIFPILRCGDGHSLTKYGRVFLCSTLFWVQSFWCAMWRRCCGVTESLVAFVWHLYAQAVYLQPRVQEEWGWEHRQVEGTNLPAAASSVFLRTWFVSILQYVTLLSFSFFPGAGMV
jgi:hypothetical protein